MRHAAGATTAQHASAGAYAVQPRPQTPPQAWLVTLNRESSALQIGRMCVDIIYHGYAAEHLDNQPHRHSFFEVCLVGRGSGRFVVAGQAQPIGRGDLFVARPGVEHQIVSTSRPAMELSWIAYQVHRDGEEQSEPLAALLDHFATSSGLVAPSGRCAGLWRALHAVAAGGELAGAPEQIGWLTAALLIGIAQAVAPIALDPAPPDRRHELLMQRALRYIDDNLGRPLSPGEVAAEVGLSQRHFTRLFRRHTGTTLARYITRARVDRARARLRNETVPIKQIAAELGFRDIHYFTRIFTRAAGMPPGSARRGSTPNGRALHTPGEFV